MAIGDVYEAEGVPDCYYLDTGMYDTPEYGCLYILDTEKPAVVDTGIGANYDATRAALDEIGIAPDELAYIIPTHVHLDHAGGAGFLARDYPNAEVLCHEVGARHLIDPARLWEGTKRAVGAQFEYYVEPEPVPEARLTEIAGGDAIDLGDRTLDVYDAPGHAPHQAVFHDPAGSVVYAADAVGIYIRRADRVDVTSPPPDFELEQSLADIETIRALDPDTLAYTHFGPAPAEGRLAEYATVLTAWVEEVAAVREELGDDEAVVEELQARSDLDELWGPEKAAAEVAMNVRGVLRYLDTHSKREE
ncbi:MBL fold metallo-hydrolase [Natronomonas sp. EA1]|uniref:MBL fold metallo-hydrolase n=1 Tax=Natronomonas sp. EA1 TaxID=3421655 RepID=UPI003EBB2EE8